jgi:UDP-glucose 4-epimerase
MVIGASGLLGSNVVRNVPSAIAPPVPIPWEADPTAGLVEAASWLARRAEHGPWRVAWCAGAGVVGSSREAMAAETRSLKTFLDALTSSCSPSQGAFFLASSAGGVHAGTSDDPVTERSPVAPMSAYGEGKLDQEQVVRAWSAATGVPAVIGRLSNLYGPGQDLTKPQGLISNLVRASLRAEPLSVFVPLDTVRDYLFVTDAARRVDALLERVAAESKRGGARTTVKLIASGRVTTIGELIAELHRIRKRRPPIVFGMTAASRLQPRALRFRSEVWPDIDKGGTVTLAEGVAAVVRDQSQALAAGTRA